MPSTTSPSWMPPADPSSAPHTGYTRAHWVAAADRILDAAWTRADANGAMVAYAADASRMDRLEGFARTFLLAALRIAGDPEGTRPLAMKYAIAFRHAMAHGVWPSLTDHSQATVEAASVAIGLHLTHDTIWTELDDATQLCLLRWFEQARGAWCADNNHVLLGATLAAFNHAHGHADGRDTVENALERIDDWYRGDGWYTDGDGRRFDHYNAYAFHWYPFFIDRMMGDALDAHRAVHRERLAAFVDGYQHMFDARCAPVFQGRSLIYRWAVAAPFWMARMEGIETVSASRTRRLTAGILKHFIDGGSLDTGVLSLGWQRSANPSIVQSYSGAGSPYWAAKGFLGLALPASDAVWTQTETPAEIEQRDVRRVLAGPRWLIDGRVDDGIVRLHNFGSDGHPTKDDPLYRRLMFTSVTRPVSGGAVRDSDITVEGSVHRPATRATAGARGGSVTRALDAGGRHVVSRVSTKVIGRSTLHVARLTGGVALSARVSGAALVTHEEQPDTNTQPRSSTAHAPGLTSSVHLVGIWSAQPATVPAPVELPTEGVIDRVSDGDDLLVCPGVRLGPLPADVVVAWSTSLAAHPEPPVEVSDLVVHEDRVALTVGNARLVLRWSRSEPFPADAESQLIFQP